MKKLIPILFSIGVLLLFGGCTTVVHDKPEPVRSSTTVIRDSSVSAVPPTTTTTTTRRSSSYVGY